MKKLFKLFALSAMAFVAACSSAPEAKTVYVKDYITEDMKAAQGSIREIENIDVSAIDANNKGLTTEILDIL